VERAIESAALKYENAALKNRAGDNEEWIGDSQAASALRASIEKVAPTNSRVMISGPAGSGKELAARLIHRNSLRESGPFIVVNAATIAPDQMESALFGEEDSQGRTTRIGLFEKAHTGTLLLDEVADMPLGTQNKILRVLTEQRFQRVGGKSDVTVDVRVMSATTKDIRHEISEGRFREELYHRLNVVPIAVPSLEERREDIPLLAKYFIERLQKEQGLTARAISDEALALLQTMTWPGNLRQLKNMVERLLIMGAGGGEITGKELSAGEAAHGSEEGGKIVLPSVMATLPLREAREEFEREYLLTQINRFGGNISRTAQFVGMERSALHRKLKSLGVVTSNRSGARVALHEDEDDEV